MKRYPLDSHELPPEPAFAAVGEPSPLLGAESRALNQVFATVTYSADGTIRVANLAFLRLLGYSLAEVVGLDASHFISSSVARTRQAGLWQRLAAGERVDQTSLWVTRSGTEVWLESRYVPLAGPDGEVGSIIQIAEDVSARLGRETEDRGMVQALQDAHVVAHFDLEGRLVFANENFCQLTGHALDELLGRPCAGLGRCEGGDRHDHGGVCWTALLQGRTWSGEYRQPSKDGRPLWLRGVFAPVSDPAGRPVKIVSYAVDITDEKVRQADYQWQVGAIHKSNAVVTFDMNGVILDANENFLAATGYRLSEIQGRHHKIFVEPSQAHGSEYLSFWNDLRRGNYRAGQFRRRGKDGREVWLQATYNPIFDADGHPVKVVKFASIVTDERLLQAEHQGQIAAIHHAHCVISFELDGTVIDANENFLEAMGYRYGEVRGQHHRMFVEPDYARSDEYAAFWHDLAKGRFRAGEFKRVSRSGEDVWLQATYNPITDMNGTVFKVVKYASIITREKLRQADYQGQIEAIRKSQDVAVLAMDGTIVDVNERFLATLGYGREEVVGQHHSMLVDRGVAASAEYEDFWKGLRAGEYSSGLYRRLGKGGKAVWIQASYNPILDLNGRVTKVVKFATDVSANVALAEAFAETKRQSQLDSTTSLPNRAKLVLFMNSHLADASASMAVLYIDLDQFKRINETFGLRVGDRALVEVADRLRRILRHDQMVARVGGDEFAIAAPGMGLEAVERFCSALAERVSLPIDGGEGREIVVGMSIGVAMAPGDGETPDELLRAADVALARSKENGRGRRSYFSEEFDAKLHGQRRLIEDMRNGYVAGEFYLEFQPRLDTATGILKSAEALVRWRHPERGLVGPADFIPLAERSGLIVPLGEWILQSACKAAVRWGGGVGVSVNVSPIQFRDGDLLQKVAAALQGSGLPPALLELEVTEGVLVEDGEHALEVLRALKAVGVSLALDDFGTGYSSLSYLKSFPFDVLKIDRSFVRDMQLPDGSRPIVQAVVALGRALGLSVTAEGVETQEQWDALRADGCDEVQGFLFARPSSAAVIDSRVREQAGRTPSRHFAVASKAA